MGEIIATGSGSTEKEFEQKRERKQKRRIDSESADTAYSGSRETGINSGTGTGTVTERTDNGSDEKEKEGNSEVSVLSEEEQKRLERNAKRREKYAQEKAENGGQAKPRKTKKSKQNNATNINVDMITTLIVSLSAIVASRENMSHWLITEAEAKTISEPLQKMFAESEQFEKLGQYSNQIALVVACVTIFAPRMMITIANSKKEVNKNVTGNSTNTNARGLVTAKKERNEKVDTGNGSRSTSNDKGGTVNATIAGLSVY